MSEDFDKSDGEINPILNALKGAQNRRQSTEEDLKKELQEELEQKVSAYIDTLGLGEKIAAEAIKGGTKITVDLDAHLENQEKICISNSDESTGLKFAKLWDEFYELMSESLTVPDTISCKLVRENIPHAKWNFFHTFSRKPGWNGVCNCGKIEEHQVHQHRGFPNYIKLIINWSN